MIVWGGESNGVPVAGGALYNEAGDAWDKALSTVSAPTARSGVAHAWSGSELLVFGGRIGGSGATSEGYAYNPAKDEWRTLPTSGAPSARYDAFGVWTDGRFLVWGGRDAAGAALETGARYDPASNTWSEVSAMGNPSKRSAPARHTGWT